MDESGLSLPPPLPDPVPPPLPEPTPEPAPEPPPKRPFPGFLQSLALLVLLIGVQVVAGGLIGILRTEWLLKPQVLGGLNVLAFGITCAVAAWFSGHSLRRLFSQMPPAGTFAGWNVMALVQAILGQLLFSVGLVYAIGGKGIEKSEYVERLSRLMGPEQGLWAVVPLLVIVAPFTEETLFRGQMLRGFLGRYSPLAAIALSAGLFSAIHMNPVQIPATFLLGMLSGFLYLRTQSVWPSIVAHMLNNSFPALALLGANGAKKTGQTAGIPLVGALALIVLGLALWLLSVNALRKWLPSGDAQPTE